MVKRKSVSLLFCHTTWCHLQAVHVELPRQHTDLQRYIFGMKWTVGSLGSSTDCDKQTVHMYSIHCQLMSPLFMCPLSTDVTPIYVPSVTADVPLWPTAAPFTAHRDVRTFWYPSCVALRYFTGSVHKHKQYDVITSHLTAPMKPRICRIRSGLPFHVL